MRRRRPRQFLLNRRARGARGLVGWWPGRFPGGKSLHDCAGKNLHGTWSGAGGHWAADATRHARVGQYNGASDTVQVAAGCPAMPVATVSAWFKADTTASNRWMVTNEDLANDGFDLRLQNGYLAWNVTTSGSTSQGRITFTDTTAWYHALAPGTEATPAYI